jgi:hypothetical protein
MRFRPRNQAGNNSGALPFTILRLTKIRDTHQLGGSCHEPLTAIGSIFGIPIGEMAA